MGVFRQFPYSNFHEMNMDQLIKIVKNMLEEWASYYAEWEEWKNDTTAAWESLQDFVNTYFDNLDVTAEVYTVIQGMVASGQFQTIVAPYIPDEVTGWLSEHISESYVVDDTLSITGAAADAKITGYVANAEYKTTPYNTVTPSGTALNANRWFLTFNPIKGVPFKVSIRTRLVEPVNIEVWQVHEDSLERIKKITTTGVAFDWLHVEITDVDQGEYMISIQAPTANTLAAEAGEGYSLKYVSDTTATNILKQNIKTLDNWSATAYVEYFECGDYVKIANLEKDINGEEISTSIPDGITGNTLATDRRFFIGNNAVTGTIKSVTLRTKRDGSVKLEVWRVIGDTLSLVYEEIKTGVAYEWIQFTPNITEVGTYYCSVMPSSGTVYAFLNQEGYESFYTADIISNHLDISNLLTFTGLIAQGFITYTTPSLENRVSVLESAIGVSDPTILTVGVNKNFASINDAVNSANDGDTIVVYPGTYNEAVSAWGKTINIVGIDRDSCILTNDKGSYAEPALEIDSGSINNMTIKATGANPIVEPSDTTNYMKDYTIHIDNAHATGKTLYINNCVIENTHRAALGIGMYDHNTVIIENCDIHSGKVPDTVSDPLYQKRGALYFHNRQPSEYFSNITEQHLIIKNCLITCDDIIAVYIGDTTVNVDMDGNNWINEMSVDFMHNTVAAKNADGTWKVSGNGVTSPPDFTNDSVISGSGFTNRLKKSLLCNNNNISYFNN